MQLAFDFYNDLIKFYSKMTLSIYDQRQLEIMYEIMEAFEKKKIDLHAFINSLDSLYSSLEQVEERWSSSLVKHIVQLEVLNAINIENGCASRIYFDTHDVGFEVIEIKKLIFQALYHDNYFGEEMSSHKKCLRLGPIQLEYLLDLLNNVLEKISEKKFNDTMHCSREKLLNLMEKVADSLIDYEKSIELDVDQLIALKNAFKVNVKEHELLDNPKESALIQIKAFGSLI